MQTAKVILISDSQSPVRVQIPFLLSQHRHFELVQLDKEIGLAGKLREIESDAIVFDSPVLCQYELVVLNEILKIKPKASLIVLADHITIFSYKEIAKFHNTIALQKPMQPAVFLSLLDKATRREDVTPDRSPRFIIDEAVRIVAERSGLVVPTRMRNYSAGGAFLEYRGISLKVGDRLSMRMTKIGKDNEPLDVKAKVVWIREGDSPTSAARGIGIQFLDI